MAEAAPRPATVGALHRDYRPPRRHLRVVDDLVDPDALTPEGQTRAMRERARCLRALWQRQAREDPNAFMEYCFTDKATGRPMEQQWFHEEWHHAMNTDPKLIIIAPRSHGKTTQVVGRIIWEIGRNSDLRVKLLGATDGRAKERLLQIQQNIVGNPRVREVFPALVPDRSLPWNAHKIYVQRTHIDKDATVEAVGVLSSATGGRADIIVPDDVVDQRNAIGMPGLRKRVKQVWFSDWSQLLEPWGRVMGICTLWHKDDLNHELMRNPTYKTLFYAIDERFGAMWANKWNEARLRDKHADIKSIEFNRAFRNIAVDFESQFVNPKWFRFVRLLSDDEFNRRVDRMQFLQSYDTAGTPTGRREQDYSASVVIAVDAEAGMIYVIDAWHARLSLKQMAARVHEEFTRYHPYRVLIEKVGQASLDEWVTDAHPEVGPYIRVFRPQQSKATRLLSGTPLLEAGRVVFSHHLDPNSPDWDPQRGSLVHELEDFGFAEHDDLVDAYSQAVWAARSYFLDRRATGADNELDVRIDAVDRSGGTPYVFF
jgi:predicted phage terminase large subunit-like protein